MLALIITGGSKPDFSYVYEYIARADLIVAADSGFDWAVEHDLQIDLLVGDLDSIQSDDTGRAKNILRFSQNKDFSDTELALSEVQRRSVYRTGIIGGGGGRFDHLLAISRLFWRNYPPDFWISNDAAMYNVDTELNLQLTKGNCVSVFSTSGKTLKAQSSGLYWPLQHADWKKQPIGISNRCVSQLVHIEVLKGRALVVVPFGE